MAIPKTNYPIDEPTIQSDEKEANGVSQPFKNEEGVDGPLLLALLMGNNNANEWAAAQPAPDAVSDTLNPDYYALELASAGNGNEEGLDNDPTSTDGEDGPLLFVLLLNNQNNNNVRDPRLNNVRPSDTLDPRDVALELKPTPSEIEDTADSRSSTIDGEDGQLLLTLLLTNQNQNQLTKGPDSSIFDTLDPRSFTLELKPAEGGNSENIDSQSVDGEDGPLLLALTDVKVPTKAFSAIPDTLDPKSVTLELKSAAVDDANFNKSSIDILSNNDQKSGDIIIKAIPDVMEMKTQLLELQSPKDTITEAIPDVMEMKTQLLELHSPGNDEANNIPVILKVNSQAQKAQILAMLQGRSIPVTLTSKDTTGNLANGTLDRAQVTTANLQSSPREAKNGNLSAEQLQFWRENGYLVIPDTLSDSQKDNLLKTVHEAAQVLAGGGERVKKHAYLPGQKSYVSPVGRAIATLSGHGFNPAVEPLKRIQRIGCGIHRVMPPFLKAILSPFHSTLAQSLGYQDPRIYQSLIIVKAAEVGARVIPHQDGCSGFTNPSSCTTFWYALEDCSTENGCLAVAPGSHRTQPITRRCITNGNGQPVFTDLENPVYAQIEGVDDSTLPKKNEKGEFEYKKLEVKAGTLILMHGNLMHKSEANQSRKSRVAFNFGVVEGEHAWLQDNYLQPYEGTTEFEKL
ncbi:hypothetical protein BPOR_0577g00020 [Botrytis porri]|uniref:Uncharacterized protein n=1 Tax=Botrytis porri TaxID=87229 RepID=A0A4Z1KE02_9HELO|nr:hypothetical protein BPOR_0577g00020 [Botrytis porri]